MTDSTENRVIELAADIVSAFVSNNSVTTAMLPALISDVYDSLQRLTASGTAEKEPEPDLALRPAVPIKKSISEDFIICLEDGKKFRSLKRHLLSSFGMTPDEYRTRWGLPSTYPMVAPGYSAARSTLAKSIGFGIRGRNKVEPVAPEPAPAASAPAAEPPKRRGRPLKKAA